MSVFVSVFFVFNGSFIPLSACLHVWLFNINLTEKATCCSLLYKSTSMIASTLLLLHPPDCDNKANAGIHTSMHVLKREAGCESCECVQMKCRRSRLRREDIYSHLPPVNDFLFTPPCPPYHLSTDHPPLKNISKCINSTYSNLSESTAMVTWCFLNSELIILNKITPN